MSRICDLKQIFSIFRFGKWFGQFFELIGSDISPAVSNFFHTGNIQALALLNNGNKLCSFQKTFVRSCIKPCHSSSQKFYMQLLLEKIFVVDRCDFQFTAGRRLNLFGDGDNLIIIEIQPRNGVGRFGVFRFLLN